MGLMPPQSSGLVPNLNSLERRLVAAVEDGETFRPQASLVKRCARIRGVLIRALLLGIPVSSSEGGGRQRRTMWAGGQGIRIVGPPGHAIRIVGRLDLADAAATGGGVLPQLALRNCIAEDEIELSGASLQSLTLEDVRFARLYATGTRFSGGVTLRRCGPRCGPVVAEERQFLGRALAASANSTSSYRFVGGRPALATSGSSPCLHCSVARDDADKGAAATASCDHCCTINFQSAQVGGNLDVALCLFRAPGLVGRQYATPKFADVSAIVLDGIRVSGSVWLTGTSTIGRVTAASAEVGEDLWVRGGIYVASAERATFNLQHSVIRGILFFGALDLPREEEAVTGIRAFPVSIIGGIGGIGVTAGDVWISEGFYFAHDPLERVGHATINFAKSTIRRTFKIGSYHEFRDPDRLSGGATISGEICLASATLGKNLEVNGAEFGRIIHRMRLRSPFLRHWFGVDPRERPYLRLSAHNLKVEGRAYLARGRFRDICPVLRGSRRGLRPLPLEEEQLASERSRKPAAIDFWKSTIGTGLRIEHPVTCNGAIRLNNCVIARELIVRCAAVRASAHDAADSRRDRIPTLIDVAESIIGGPAKIGRLPAHRRRRFQKDSERHDPPVDRTLFVEGAISFANTLIEGNLAIGNVTIDLRLDGAMRARAEGNLSPGANSLSPVPADSAVRPEEGIDPEDRRVALNLRDCSCKSDLEVRCLRWLLPEPTGPELEGYRLPHAYDRASEAMESKGYGSKPADFSRSFLFFRGFGTNFGLDRFRLIHQGYFAVADLRGLGCASLLDDFGTGWGFIYRIQLRADGMEIGQVESASHGGGPARRPEKFRMRWLAHQHTVQLIDGLTETPRRPHFPRVTFAERLVTSWRDDFVPQTYQVFSSAYRRAGEDLTADRILVEKKDRENSVYIWRLSRRWFTFEWAYILRLCVLVLFIQLALFSESSVLANDTHHLTVSRLLFALVAGMFIFWPLVVAIFQMLFKSMFRYGLSTERGLLVYAISIAIGWAGVHVARNGGWRPLPLLSAQADSLPENVALVLAVEPEPFHASGAEAHSVGGRSSRAGALRREAPAIIPVPSLCNEDVTSFLYAVDTFIPLLDLDQEQRCAIRPASPHELHDGYLWWRVAKAAYEVVGWLVTSLLVLTVSGVLRRDLER
jgi:hypothetical protein